MARDSGEAPLKTAYHRFNGLNTEFKNLEPKKDNRFILYTQDIPTHGLATPENVERSIYSLLLSVDTFKRPSYTNSAYSIDHFNEKLFFAGKDSSSKEISCTFWDYIGTNETTTLGVNNTSPAAVLYRWYMVMHDLDYGSIGYQKYYTTDFYLYVLAPNGFVVETWKYYQCFPTSVDFGDVKYGGSANMKINVTLKYSKARLISENAINNETKDKSGTKVKEAYLDSAFQNTTFLKVNTVGGKESLDSN